MMLSKRTSTAVLFCLAAILHHVHSYIGVTGLSIHRRPPLLSASFVRRSNIMEQQTARTSLVLLMASSSSDDEEGGDFLDGYDEFVANLDFDSDDWADDKDYNNGPQRRGGGDRRRNNNSGYQSGGYGSGGGRDYQRAPDDDTSIPADVEQIEYLLGERLKSRKRGDFDTADALRDELRGKHGVTVWDKDKVWTTNPNSRGGSARHRGNGRYASGRRQQQRPGGRRHRDPVDFGPHGHDYAQTGGPILSSLDEDEINTLIAERLQCKLNRDFDTADAIQTRLEGEGVKVHDGFKQWRADGEAWPAGDRRRDGRGEGRFGSGGGGGRRQDRVDFGPKGHDYSQTGGPIMSPLSEDEINELLAERLQAKMNRDFETADDIKMRLQDEGVLIHDRFKEWRADGEIWTRQQRRNRHEVREYTRRGVRGNLSEEDLEYVLEQMARRSEAKRDGDYDLADEIKNDLSQKFEISIDDRNLQWFVRVDEYQLSPSSDPLSSEIEAAKGEIEAMLMERTRAKKDRNYEAADEIRTNLNEKYGITIDDHLKEWTFIADEMVGDDATYDSDAHLSQILEGAEEEELVGDEYPAAGDEGVNGAGDDFSPEEHAAADGSEGAESLESLTVVQLKEKLRTAGLPVSGRKAELIERLTTADVK